MLVVAVEEEEGQREGEAEAPLPMRVPQELWEPRRALCFSAAAAKISQVMWMTGVAGGGGR